MVLVGWKLYTGYRIQDTGYRIRTRTSIYHNGILVIKKIHVALDVVVRLQVEFKSIHFHACCHQQTHGLPSFMVLWRRNPLHSCGDWVLLCARVTDIAAAAAVARGGG